MLLVSCGQQSKKLDERISLWRKDKIPYGTFYTYENLKYMFPDAEIIVNKRSPDRFKSFNLGESIEIPSSGKSAMVIISPKVLPDESELNALFNYVSQGNHLFISSLDISDNLLDSLKLKVAHASAYYRFNDSLTVEILNPVTYESSSFTYPGVMMDNSFSSLDSGITNISGKDKYGKANFVRFTYESGGSIAIHLAPMAFTNFFLLHKQNKAYYDNVLSYLPYDIRTLTWDDYFRNRNPRQGSFSKLSAFMKNDMLRWALWLVILLFALIYLFESKRKQRIVPVMSPLKNASLDFVRTIGRLYYQRKDNKNLALKMSAHFLDYVRNRYHLPTSVLNEDFETKLAHKSGYDQKAISDIVYAIKTLPDHPQISDDDLLRFNNQIERFLSYQ